MSKKLASAICCSVLVISCGICSLGYILGDSSHPWWLIVLAGGITCAIVSMANGVKEETDETKKSSKFIGTICASISMISVLVFLVLMFVFNVEKGWIAVCIGGIVSLVTKLLYEAIKNNKDTKEDK